MAKIRISEFSGKNNFCPCMFGLLHGILHKIPTVKKWLENYKTVQDKPKKVKPEV